MVRKTIENLYAVTRAMAQPRIRGFVVPKRPLIWRDCAGPDLLYL